MSLKWRIVLLAIAAELAVGFGLPFAVVAGCTADFYAFLFGFVPLFFVFWWVQVDRRQKGIARSRGFNIGLASMALVFVPAHLWCSRPLAQGALAIAGFFLMLVVASVALLIGVAGGVLSQAILNAL